jgi:hypothetical protein
MPVNATITASYLRLDARPLRHLLATRYCYIKSLFHEKLHHFILGIYNCK